MIPLKYTAQRAPFVLAIIFAIVPTIAVSAQVVTRRMRKRPLACNDYAIFVALISSYFISGGEIFVVVAGGLGRHYPAEVTDAELLIFYKWLTELEISYGICLGFVRISLCLLYIEIFAIPVFRKATYVVMGFCIAFMLTVIMSNLLICQPVSYNWDITVNGSCGNRVALWASVGALNALTDLAVLSLLVRMVWRLHTTRRNKVALTITFGLGILVCIASMLRLKYVLDVDITGDFTFSSVEACIWSMLEPCLAVTIACAPSLGPILNSLLGYKRDPHSKTHGRHKLVSNAQQLQRLDGGMHPTNISAELKSAGLRSLDEMELSVKQSVDSKNDSIRVTSQWEIGWL